MLSNVTHTHTRTRASVVIPVMFFYHLMTFLFLNVHLTFNMCGVGASILKFYKQQGSDFKGRLSF